MPSIGFGVFQIPVNETERIVTDALEAGYRMIDTAASYFNEEQVGNALRHSGLKREDVFVTTKLWVQDYEYDDALRAFDLSMKKLGLDYLDLYLLHKPYGNYYAAWRAAERLYREGRIRAIGVTSFSNERLPIIIDAGETRYWVRKIVPLKSDDTDFLQKLKAEIPAFLHFLQHRQLSTGKESRMWFNPKLLETEALRKIIRSNRNRLEIEMTELLLDIMAKMNVESVSFCLNDIIPLLVCSQVKVEKSQVRKVVQECWKLTPAPNGLTYTAYQYGGNDRYQTRRSVGRYYTVTKGLLEKL